MSGSRVLPLSEFFLGYKKTALGADEVLTSIIIPPRENDQVFAALKVSKRKDQDISAVMAAFSYRLENGHFHDVRLAFGGMSATPMLADFTNAALEGQPASEATVAAALAALDDDFSPIDDLRATAWYRMTVSCNLLEQALTAAAETPQEFGG